MSSVLTHKMILEMLKNPHIISITHAHTHTHIDKIIPILSFMFLLHLDAKELGF